MIHLLIDNCSLLQLSSKEGFNEYLLKLENYINNEEIMFLTHEHIIHEWEKHKVRDKNRKERLLLFQKANNDSDLNGSSNLLPTKIDVNIDHLNLQIKLIDSLLEKAEVLTTPEAITNEFVLRFRNKLAPVHKKKDSLNDWEIIGSACAYCEGLGIKQLYFLSNNHTDFADEENPSRKIHPSIESRFSKVKINYFKNYSDLFNELNSSHFPHQFITFNFISNTKFSYKATIKKTDFESINYLFKNLYEEIDFIPIHIIINYYPFSESEDSNVYYNHFFLNNVREKLIETFDKIEIIDNKIVTIDPNYFNSIENYEVVIKEVLNSLTRNLIYKLVDRKNNREVETYFNESIFCDCYNCALSRFDFPSSLDGLKNVETSLKGKMKLAYFNYKLGNFKASAQHYLEISNEAYNERKYILYFIAKYNLSHLVSFLQNPFYNKDVAEDLISEIGKIDPLEEAVKLKSFTDYNLLTFIAQEDFFTNPFQNIKKKVSKILDHYFSQLDGGWSHNSDYWDLTEEFAKLDGFINYNFIIYDKYSNFDNLFEIVTEGLLASLAINKNSGSSLKRIDDYWLKKLISYGKSKTIIKYFNRFNLSFIEYKSSTENKNLFLELTSNFFLKEKITKEKYINNCEPSNEYFPLHYNSTFENIVTMAALLNLNKKALNEFSEKLLFFLQTQTLIRKASFESVRLFFGRKGKFISKKLLRKFFNFFFENPNDFDSSILNYIIRSYEDNSLNFLSNRRINLILIKSFDNKGDYQSNPYSNLWFRLYKKVKLDQKDQISRFIADKLSSKDNFNLFYIATLYDIIPKDEIKLMGFLERLDTKLKNPSFRSVFSGEDDYQNSRGDEILNLFFKFNLNTDIPQFNKIKKVHPYYKWLINLDTFDYKKFDPYWVLKYQTLYYFQRMSKSKELIKALVNFLKNNSHEGIAKVLISLSPNYE